MYIVQFYSGLVYIVLLHHPTTTSSSTSSYYIDLLHRLRGQFSYIALCVSPNCPSHVTQLDGRLSHIVNVIIWQMLQISIWEFGNCKLGEIYILVNCMDCMSQIDVLYLFVIHITMNEVICWVTNSIGLVRWVIRWIKWNIPHISVVLRVVSLWYLSPLPKKQQHSPRRQWQLFPPARLPGCQSSLTVKFSWEAKLKLKGIEGGRPLLQLPS